MQALKGLQVDPGGGGEFRGRTPRSEEQAEDGTVAGRDAQTRAQERHAGRRRKQGDHKSPAQAYSLDTVLKEESMEQIFRKRLVGLRHCTAAVGDTRVTWTWLLPHGGHNGARTLQSFSLCAPG